MLETRAYAREHLPNIGSFCTTDDRDICNGNAVRDFIKYYDNAFSRDDDVGHITASAFIINDSRDAVLLTHHAKLDCWLQVGGHCDGIRDPRSTALREAKEETGLSSLSFLSHDIFDIDIHEIPATTTSKAHLHFDIRYLLRADDREQLVITSESLALRWVELDELHAYTNKTSVLIIIDKLKLL